MTTIDKSLLMYTPCAIMADASTVGIKPGMWPEMISIVDDDRHIYTILKSSAEISVSGDIIYMNYVEKNGRIPIVKVFND